MVENLQVILNDLNNRLIELNRKRTEMESGMRRKEERVVSETVEESSVKLEENVCRKRKAIIVENDYAIQPDDYYVGVKGKKDVTLTLPVESYYGEIVIKLEVATPVTIVCGNSDSTIDDDKVLKLQSAFEVVQLFQINNNWKITSYM